MATYSLPDAVETAAAAYLGTLLGLEVRTTEDSSMVWDKTDVFAAVESTSGLEGLPGNARLFVRIEVRTFLPLYSSRPAAIDLHRRTFQNILSGVMVAEFGANLEGASSDFTVDGVASGEEMGRRLDSNGMLISTITREITAHPKA